MVVVTGILHFKEGGELKGERDREKEGRKGRGLMRSVARPVPVEAILCSLSILDPSSPAAAVSPPPLLPLSVYLCLSLL